MTATAAILAGGASRRFGSVKARHSINGRPMIAIVAGRLHTLFNNIIVAGWLPDQRGPEGMRCFFDKHSGKDALGGIHTALANSVDEWVFCCGCDMPLIQPPVVQRIIASIGDEDILLPVIGGVRQPLHAVYMRRLLPVVDRLCLSSTAFLPQLFETARVRCLEESSFSDIPDYRLSFLNVNTRDDLNRYAEYLTAH